MAINLTITTSIDAADREIPQANLPVAATTITGNATDPADAGAVFEYNWTILDKPPTSTASLSSATGAQITLQNADVWGTYRIFCVVQNITSGEISPRNPLVAHSSFFVDLVVVSTRRQLQKPARTQRDWHDEYWKLVDAVDELSQGAIPMCPTEIYDQDGDFLVYDLTCADNPSADQPGFHAINYREKVLATYLPKASPGTSDIWGDTWNANVQQLIDNPDERWEDNAYNPGIVATAGVYAMARGDGYFNPTSLSDIQATQATALISLAMTPSQYVTSLIGNRGDAVLLSVLGDEPVTGTDTHFVSPLTSDTEFTAYQNTNGQAPGANVLQNAHTIFNLHMLGRTSIGKLGDVDLTSVAPQDGDVLVWDSSAGTGTVSGGFNQPQVTGAWKPAAQSGGSGVQDKIQEDGGSTKVETIDTQADGSDAQILYTIDDEDAFEMVVPVGHDVPNAIFRPMKDCLNDLGHSGNRFRDLHICRDVYIGGNRVAVGSAGEISVEDSSNNTTKIAGYTGTETTNSILQYISGAWQVAPAPSTGVDGLSSNSSNTVTLSSGYALVPAADNAQDLGSTSAQYANVYANEFAGDANTKLSLNADIPGTPSVGLKSAALYSAGSIAMMIDTNNSGTAAQNSFYVYEGGTDDSSATERFRVENDGSVRINNAYNLPTADGSANRVMRTNGNGVLSFANAEALVPQTMHLHHAGKWEEEISTHQTVGTEYTFGVGESPIIMCKRNYSSGSMVITDYDVMVTKMMSSTIDFSLVVFTNTQYTSNKATSLDADFQMTRTNEDSLSNDEGLGLSSLTGKSLVIPPGSWVGLVMHNYEKSGHDNEHFTMTLRYTIQ